MEIHHFYDKFVAEHFDQDPFDLYGTSRLKAIEQSEKLILREPVKILDVGLGTGNLLLELAQRYPHSSLFGLDTSEGMINKARAKLKNFSSRITFIQDHGLGLSSHPELHDMDLISLHFVLNYVDHKAMIEAVKGILNEKGALSIATTTADSFSNLFEVAKNFVSEDFLNSQFHVPKNGEELVGLLQDSGFVVVEISPFEKKISFKDFDELIHFALHSGWFSSPFFSQLSEEQVTLYREFGQSLFPFEDTFRAVNCLAVKG